MTTRCSALYGSDRCVLLEGHVEDHRLTWRVERRESPEGNPQRSGEAGTSSLALCPNGPSEHSTDPITCARCGRELRSLEQIRDALESAPGAAIAVGRYEHPKEPYSFALRHMTCAVGEAVRDLACHSGTCHPGML